MSDLLLVLWLALLPLERVDFFAGNGPFLLMPYLLLSVLLVATEVVRIAGRGGGFRVPRNAGDFALLASMLLAVMLVSVFYSFDIDTSAKRFALLVFQIYTCLAAVVCLAQRPDPARILVRGAAIGLVLGAVMNLVQLFVWFQQGDEPFLVAGGVVDLTARTFGPWVPRLSAMSLDMNRGGLATVIQMYLLIHLARPSRTRTALLWLGGVGAALSLSRSLFLAVLVMLVVSRLLKRRRSTLSHGQAVVGLAAMTLFVFSLIAVPQVSAAFSAIAEPLSHRFSSREESASIHVELIERAVEVATDSPRNALVGIGYGNSFLATQDFFPGDKHGNFHSFYLTILAECGAVALLLVMLLLLYPAVRGGMYRPLILGVMVFSIPYQLGSDPMFWLVLVLAWTRLCDPAASGLVARPAPVVPRQLVPEAGW